MGSELEEWVKHHNPAKCALFLKYVYKPKTSFDRRLASVVRYCIGEQVIEDFYRIEDAAKAAMRARQNNKT